MKTSVRSEQQLSLRLTSGVQGGHARISVTPTPTDRGSTGNGADSSTRSWDWLQRFILDGSSWRTCRVSSRRTKEPLLRQLPTASKRMGIWGDGFRVTSSMRAFPTTGIEFSLSQVTSPIVPISSLLTATNCLGILRREERAGRTLDPHFKRAIDETLRLWSSVAEVSGTPQQRVFAPRFVPKLDDIKAVIQTDRFSVARNLTWDECEALMGFPVGWTVVEGDSLATPSPPSSSSGSGVASSPSKRAERKRKPRRSVCR